MQLKQTNISELSIEKQQNLLIDKIIPTFYKRELQLVKYVTITSEQKNGTIIMQALNKINQQNQKTLKNSQNPLKSQKQKQFLKRIKKIQNNEIQVIICQEDYLNKDAMIAAIKQLNINTKMNIQQLPKYAPLTKSQFDIWSKIWPTIYIQQEITKQPIHSQSHIQILKSLKTNTQQYNDDIYLLDGKTLKILLKQSGQCQDKTIQHPIMKMLKLWPKCQNYMLHQNQYYYLTGLKIFSRKLLCGMCSMALVHSRLYSIYMSLKPNQVMENIMSCPKINHQIIIFHLS